jgi:hypothetical protein
VCRIDRSCGVRQVPSWRRGQDAVFRAPSRAGGGADPILRPGDDEAQALGIGPVERFRDMRLLQGAETGVEPDLLHRDGDVVESAQAADAEGVRGSADVGQAVGLSAWRRSPAVPPWAGRRRPAPPPAGRARRSPRVARRPARNSRTPAAVRSARVPSRRPAPSSASSSTRRSARRGRVRSAAGRRGRAARADLDRQVLGDAQIGGQGARFGGFCMARGGPP